MRYIVGIDPGKKGGVCLIKEDLLEPQVWPCPKEVDGQAKLIWELYRKYDIHCAILEKAGAYAIRGRKQGAKGMFSYGEGFGAWRGAIVVCLIPYLIVAPKVWQKITLDTGDGNTKDRSIKIVNRLYPELSLTVKDDGIADAVNIARYGGHLMKQGLL